MTYPLKYQAKSMIITKDQYETYIIPGAILRRTLYNKYGKNQGCIKVLSEPYDHKTGYGHTLKVFKYKAILSNDHVLPEREYFISDLFRGTVEILNWNDFITDDEFQI